VLHKAIEGFLEAQAIWADPLGKVFVAIFAAIYKPIPLLKDFLNGVWFGHPLHPAITDVPIGAYVVAVVLDFSGQRTAATAAIGVGIVFMLLAALAGYADYIDLEGKSRRFGTVHSSLMLVALVVYLVSFVMRLGAVPSPAEVWLSVIGFLIVISSAYVGGELVYNLHPGRQAGQSEGRCPDPRRGPPRQGPRRASRRVRASGLQPLRGKDRGRNDRVRLPWLAVPVA
jgi:uncharacterized membrane protein